MAGVDVGGTNIEVGLVSGDHEVHERGKVPTPVTGPDDVLDAIAGLVDDLGGDPVAVGVGVPGVVHEGQVLTVPDLQGWHGAVDLVGGLSSRLRAPLTLGDDANVACWASGSRGRPRRRATSSGSGRAPASAGGLVLDGRPSEGSRGSAGEIEHVLVQPGGAICGCGRRGCVEAYAGRRSLSGSVAAMVEAGWSTDLYEFQEDEGRPALTSTVWARALEEDDALAQRLLATAVERLRPRRRRRRGRRGGPGARRRHRGLTGNGRGPRSSSCGALVAGVPVVSRP